MEDITILNMNLFGLSGFLTAITGFALVVMILVHSSKTFLSRIWALFMITVGIWGVGVYYIAQVPFGGDEKALLLWRLAHIGVTLIPVFFFHFIYIFLEIKKKILLYIIYSLGIFFFITNATGYLVIVVTYMYNFYYDSSSNILYLSFFSFFMSAVIYGHYLMFKKYKESPALKQKQIRYFFLATGLGFAGGFTVFLPAFGIDIYPIGNMTVFLGLLIVTYGVIKHQLLSIKTVAIELFLICTWVLFFTRLFLMKDLGGFYVDILLFVAVVLLGIMVIRSALQEFKYREQLQTLNETLQEKIDAQTKKIREAYEIEKSARKKLEALGTIKSNFISVAAHQLRTPLSAIQWSIRMILDDEQEKLITKHSKLLNQTYSANKNLIQIVNDLLNVTQIEGKNFGYEMNMNNIFQVINETIAGLQILVRDKNLQVSFNKTEELVSFVFDRVKIMIALKNIIGNAIDYTPNGGGIVITLSKEENNAVITVVDTGIGISKGEQEQLFTKFYRSEKARKMETDRSGLGLWITKQIIEKHNGTITVLSDTNKGTTVKICLPTVSRTPLGGLT